MTVYDKLQQVLEENTKLKEQNKKLRKTNAVLKEDKELNTSYIQYMNEQVEDIQKLAIELMEKTRWIK